MGSRGTVVEQLLLRSREQHGKHILCSAWLGVLDRNAVQKASLADVSLQRDHA